jgi:hypothetical protein
MVGLKLGIKTLVGMNFPFGNRIPGNAPEV